MRQKSLLFLLFIVVLCVKTAGNINAECLETGNIAYATYSEINSDPNTNEILNLSTYLTVVCDTTIQQIILPVAWSIFSTYVQPFQPDMSDVMVPVLSNANIIKDGNGLVYWPQFSLNLIGNITLGEGYQIKMQTTDTLWVTGELIQPETVSISLPAGWSIIGVLRTTPAPINTLLSPLVNNLLIAKNGIGQVFWPMFNFNAIGNMKPGEGYQVKLSVQDTLVFPPNQGSSTDTCGGTVTDFDGNTYNTVQIGFQCWMKENLSSAHYSNGDALIYGAGAGNISGNDTTKYYFDYYFNPPYSTLYGKAYTYAAATNGETGAASLNGHIQGICPVGWHLPNDEEWKILQGNADSYFNYPDLQWDVSISCGHDVGKNLKSVSGWNNYDPGFGGTDLSGFSAFPCNSRAPSGSICGNGIQGVWWTSTFEGEIDDIFVRSLYYHSKKISRYTRTRDYAFSVRCLRDTFIMPDDVPTVVSSPISDITQTTVSCGGDVAYDGESAVISRGVCWNTTNNPTISDSVVYFGSGLGNYTISLNNLSPNTSYSLRAFAINSTGTGYGTTMQFSTLDSSFICGDQIIDADGNTYNTILIGSQCWMKENLHTTHYANGIALTDGTNVGHIGGDTLGRYHFNKANNPANIQVYGKLYTWNTVINGFVGSNSVPSGIQGICPIGWHVPSDEEWKILEGTADSFYNYPDSVWDAAGGRGTDAGSNLKSTSGWGTTGNGTDIYGFSALNGGGRPLNGGVWQGGFWWSSTEHDSNSAWYRLLYDYSPQIIRNNMNFKSFGYSVRCLKD